MIRRQVSQKKICIYCLLMSITNRAIKRVAALFLQLRAPVTKAINVASISLSFVFVCEPDRAVGAPASPWHRYQQIE